MTKQELENIIEARAEQYRQMEKYEHDNNFDAYRAGAWFLSDPLLLALDALWKIRFMPNGDDHNGLSLAMYHNANTAIDKIHELLGLGEGKNG